jgi:hypothetical protein
MKHLAGTVTMPWRSRRATITPTEAVSVSRSPARQFRTWLIAWLVSRPEVSIRLIP